MITVSIVLILLYGNLRGLREAGRVFAVPTYLFIVSTGSVIVVGLIREAVSGLPQANVHTPGALPLGTHQGSGFLMGATVFVMLKALANGGSSLTGLEAISNGVSSFRPPEGPNARRVLVVMATILGSLVLGVSILAHLTHAIPYDGGVTHRAGPGGRTGLRKDRLRPSHVSGSGVLHRAHPVDRGQHQL